MFEKEVFFKTQTEAGMNRWVGLGVGTTHPRCNKQSLFFLCCLIPLTETLLWCASVSLEEHSLV